MKRSSRSRIKENLYLQFAEQKLNLKYIKPETILEVYKVFGKAKGKKILNYWNQITSEKTIILPKIEDNVFNY